MGRAVYHMRDEKIYCVFYDVLRPARCGVGVC